MISRRGGGGRRMSLLCLSELAVCWTNKDTAIRFTDKALRSGFHIKEISYFHSILKIVWGHAVEWSRHYATSRKVTSANADEFI
jgi:hypothetical protein